jgi:hypothetical protein
MLAIIDQAEGETVVAQFIRGISSRSAKSKWGTAESTD